MLKNYIKLAIRNIYRQKGYSLINILGLALGMACTVMIFQWVQDELSYDRFHKNADNLYIATFSNGSTTTPTALSAHLKNEFPEISNTCRCSFSSSHALKYGEIKSNQKGGVLVDPSFLDMFTLPFIEGDAKTALQNPHSIVISQKLAQTFFGDRDPIGKVLLYEGEYDLMVTGVMTDYPRNSAFQFEYLVPLSLSREYDYPLDIWDWNNIQTFATLNDQVLAEQVNKKIAAVVEQHRPKDKRTLSLQPITRMHLYNYPQGGGLITYVYLFSLLAAFILIIACINFMNLSTARSAKRSLEVGIRKTIGAFRSDLTGQFFIESLLYVLMALILSFLIILLSLPLFNSLTGKVFTPALLLAPSTFAGITAIALLTALLAGSYPALYLSHFQPLRVLKGSVHTKTKGSLLRKVLVVAQFTISVFLIIASLVILGQISYMRNKDLGIDTDHIVYIRVNKRFWNSADKVRQKMSQNPNILNMTLTNSPPYYWDSNAGLGSVSWQGQTHQQTPMVQTAVDNEYMDTFKLKLAQGRFFSKSHSSDAEDAYVVNQAAVRAMEMESPIGKELTISGRKGKIIGVLQDYHYESLHRSILPMAMQITPNWYSTACFRIRSENVQETIAFIRDCYQEIYPDNEFNIHFLDESIDAQYKSEQRIGRIFRFFTFLAIFISCLGLFGLASFTAEQSRKEIGIRKVLGASHTGLIFLLSKEFLKWVLAANIVAGPLAWTFMNRWLNGFAYKADISIVIFLSAAAASMTIALLTVTFQTIRATMANPVNSLKYE